MLQWAATPKLVLTGSGLVGSTIDSQIKGGPFVPGMPGIVGWQAGLGNSAIYKLAGSADYASTQNIHGNIGVEYTNYEYGQSQPFVNTAVGGLAIEPHSRTENVTVRAGLGWAFGAAPVVAKY